MAVFQPEPQRTQSPQVIPIIEMQYDYYTPLQTYQQPQIPKTLPIYQTRVDPLPIIAIVGVISLLGFLAFLAFLKR